MRENHGSSFDNSSQAMKTLDLKSVNLQGSMPRSSQQSAKQGVPTTEKNLDTAIVQVPPPEI